MFKKCKYILPLMLGVTLVNSGYSMLASHHEKLLKKDGPSLPGKQIKGILDSISVTDSIKKNFSPLLDKRKSFIIDQMDKSLGGLKDGIIRTINSIIESISHKAQDEKRIIEEKRFEKELRITEENHRKAQEEKAKLAQQIKDQEEQEKARLAQEEEERKARERDRLAQQIKEQIEQEQKRLAQEEEERKARERDRLAQQEEERKARERDRLAQQEEERKAREKARLAEEARIAELKAKEEQRRRIELEKAEQIRKAQDEKRLAQEEKAKLAEEARIAQEARLAGIASQIDQLYTSLNKNTGTEVNIDQSFKVDNVKKNVLDKNLFATNILTLCKNDINIFTESIYPKLNPKQNNLVSLLFLEGLIELGKKQDATKVFKILEGQTASRTQLLRLKTQLK